MSHSIHTTTGDVKTRPRTQLNVRQLPVAASPTLCTKTTAALYFTRLFIILSPPHLFLDSTALYQFSESSDRFLNRFPVTYQQLNHSVCSKHLLLKCDSIFNLFILIHCRQYPIATPSSRIALLERTSSQTRLPNQIIGGSRAISSSGRCPSSKMNTSGPRSLLAFFQSVQAFYS